MAGLIVAVGILSSIPLYADAVQQRLMQGELTEAGTYRPPFSFLWRYIGTWNGNIDRDKYQPIDEYISQQAANTIGLPLSLLVRHVQTDKLRLFPAGDTQSREPLLWMTLGFISGLEDHIQLSEGAFPREGAPGSAPDGDVEVLVSQTLADAQKMSDDYRACVVQNKAESDVKQQRKCIKQVDPSIPNLLIGITE